MIVQVPRLEKPSKLSIDTAVFDADVEKARARQEFLEERERLFWRRLAILCYIFLVLFCLGAAMQWNNQQMRNLAHSDAPSKYTPPSQMNTHAFPWLAGAARECSGYYESHPSHGGLCV